MNEELKCEIGLLAKYIDEFSWLCTNVYYGAQAQKDARQRAHMMK